MTEQAQTGRNEGAEAPIATPRLIEILTPTEESYPRLIHVNLFRNPEDPEDRLLKMEYLTPPTNSDGFPGDAKIELSENDFYGQIIPWFENELQRITGNQRNLRTGETIFQYIQEGLLAINNAPESERRRLTGILVGLAEVETEFDSREVIED